AGRKSRHRLCAKRHGVQARSRSQTGTLSRNSLLMSGANASPTGRSHKEMPNDRSKTIPRALSGVRVLALEVSVAGPHCTRILGDMGAEVIKIEKPGTGDLIRNWDSAVRGLSSGYVWLNGNKRSFAIDVKKKAGLEALLRLADRADVFLENFARGVA